MIEQFTCPACNARLRVPSERVGEILTCPRCKAAVPTLEGDSVTLPSDTFHVTAPADADEEVESFLESVMAEEPAEVSGSRSHLSDVRTVTSPNLRCPGQRIAETLEAVHALRVIAMGPLSDLKTLFRDAVGGRARTAETIFEKARAEVIADLKGQAARRHAHAIVSLNIEIGELNQSIVFVSAAGTPVRLEDVP